MKLQYAKSLLLPLMVVMGSVAAQSPPPPGEGAPPPPLPPKLRPSEESLPTVTIHREESRIIEEYRVDGAVVMVRVTPNNAPPYYLIDADRDGSLETRTSEIDKVQPVYWKLFEW